MNYTPEINIYNTSDVTDPSALRPTDDKPTYLVAEDGKNTQFKSDLISSSNSIWQSLSKSIAESYDNRSTVLKTSKAIKTSLKTKISDNNISATNLRLMPKLEFNKLTSILLSNNYDIRADFDGDGKLKMKDASSMVTVLAERTNDILFRTTGSLDQTENDGTAVEGTGSPTIQAITDFENQYDNALDQFLAELSAIPTRYDGNGYIALNDADAAKLAALMKKIQGLLNLELLLFSLTETKDTIVDVIYSIGFKDEPIKKKSFLENVSETVSKRMQAINGQFQKLLQTIDEYNKKVYDEKIKAAEAERDKKKNSGESVVNFVIPGSVDATRNLHAEREMEVISKAYEGVKASIEKAMETALLALVPTGGLCGDKLGELAGKATSGNLTLHIGEDYDFQDLNSEFTTALQAAVTYYQNLEKTYYSLKDTKDEILETVIKIVFEIQVQEREGSKRLAGMALKQSHSLFSSLLSDTINATSSLIDAHNDTMYHQAEGDKWQNIVNSYGIAMALSPLTMFCGGLIGVYCSFLLAQALAQMYNAEYIHDGRNYSDFNIGKYNNYLQEFGLNPNQNIDTAGYDEIAMLLLKLQQEQENILIQLGAGRDESLTNNDSGVIGLIDGSLGGSSSVVINSGGDPLITDEVNGCKGINANAVNDLMDRFNALEAVEIAVILIKKAKATLNDIAIQVFFRSESNSAEVWDNTLDSIKASNQVRRLAVDAQIDRLQKKVEEFNRQRTEQLMAEQALINAALSVVNIIGSIVAAALAIAGGPIGIAIAAVITIGLGALNWAVRSWQAGKYDGFKPATDTNIYDTYEPANYNDPVANALANNGNRTRDDINNVNMSNCSYEKDGFTYVNAAGITDTALGISQTYFLQITILMTTKSRQDLMRIILAMFFGVDPGDSGTSAAKMVLDNNFQNNMEALSLRISQLANDIQITNMKSIADKAESEAETNFYISLASAALTALSAIKMAAELVWTLKILGICLNVGATLHNLLDAINDAKDKAFKEIQAKARQAFEAQLDDMFKNEKDVFIKALIKALKNMNEDLVENIGNGNVGFNFKAFYQIRQQIDKLFNAQLCLIELMKAKSDLQSMILQMTAGYAATSDWDMIQDGVNNFKNSAMVTLDAARMRVEGYVDKHNQLNDAKRALVGAWISAVINLTSSAISLTDTVVNISKGNEPNALNNFSLMKSLTPKWLENIMDKLDKFTAKSTTNYALAEGLSNFIKKTLIAKLSDLIYEQFLADDWGEEAKGQKLGSEYNVKAPSGKTQGLAASIEQLDYIQQTARESMGQTKFDSFKSEKLSSLRKMREERMQQFLQSALEAAVESIKNYANFKNMVAAKDAGTKIVGRNAETYQNMTPEQVTYALMQQGSAQAVADIANLPPTQQAGAIQVILDQAYSVTPGSPEEIELMTIISELSDKGLIPKEVADKVLGKFTAQVTDQINNGTITGAQASATLEVLPNSICLKVMDNLTPEKFFEVMSSPQPGSDETQPAREEVLLACASGEATDVYYDFGVAATPGALVEAQALAMARQAAPVNAVTTPEEAASAVSNAAIQVVNSANNFMAVMPQAQITEVNNNASNLLAIENKMTQSTDPNALSGVIDDISALQNNFFQVSSPSPNEIRFTTDGKDISLTINPKQKSVTVAEITPETGTPAQPVRCSLTSPQNHQLMKNISHIALHYSPDPSTANNVSNFQAALDKVPVKMDLAVKTPAAPENNLKVTPAATQVTINTAEQLLTAIKTQAPGRAVSDTRVNPELTAEDVMAMIRQTNIQVVRSEKARETQQAQIVMNRQTTAEAATPIIPVAVPFVPEFNSQINNLEFRPAQRAANISYSSADVSAAAEDSEVKPGDILKAHNIKPKEASPLEKAAAKVEQGSIKALAAFQQKNEADSSKWLTSMAKAAYSMTNYLPVKESDNPELAQKLKAAQDQLSALMGKKTLSLSDIETLLDTLKSLSDVCHSLNISVKVTQMVDNSMVNLTEIKEQENIQKASETVFNQLMSDNFSPETTAQLLLQKPGIIFNVLGHLGKYLKETSGNDKKALKALDNFQGLLAELANSDSPLVTPSIAGKAREIAARLAQLNLAETRQGIEAADYSAKRVTNSPAEPDQAATASLDSTEAMNDRKIKAERRGLTAGQAQEKLMAVLSGDNDIPLGRAESQDLTASLMGDQTTAQAALQQMLNGLAQEVPAINSPADLCRHINAGLVAEEVLDA